MFKRVETMMKKTILIIILSLISYKFTHAAQTIYTSKNDLNWQVFDFHYVFFSDGEKVSRKIFDQRMEKQVDIFKARHEPRIKFAKNLQDKLQAECDYLADAQKLLAVYMQYYPKLLQQKDAKPIFFQYREYLDHFKTNNSKCET